VIIQLPIHQDELDRLDDHPESPEEGQQMNFRLPTREELHYNRLHFAEELLVLEEVKSEDSVASLESEVPSDEFGEASGPLPKLLG
jgi:hypothetical protein